MTVNRRKTQHLMVPEGQILTDRIFSDSNGFGNLYEPPIGLAICSENVDKMKNRPTFILMRLINT